MTGRGARSPVRLLERLVTSTKKEGLEACPSTGTEAEEGKHDDQEFILALIEIRLERPYEKRGV